MATERQLTLDPGRTAIAIRALRSTDGHYPFLEGALGTRRWSALLTGVLRAAWRRRCTSERKLPDSSART
jgi:hypothetical protein